MTEQKKIETITKNQGLMLSFILFFIITILALSYNIICIKITKKECYDLLFDSTRESCSKIETQFKTDRKNLELFALPIEYRLNKTNKIDEVTIKKVLASYPQTEYITSISVITKDNTLIQTSDLNKTETLVQFEEYDHAQFSDLETSMSDDIQVIKNIVPIRKNGEAACNIFTEIDPVKMINVCKPAIYKGSAKACIIDSKTGNILMNNWDTRYSNIKNTNNDQLANSICNQETGCLDIKDAAGKNYIISYIPMTIENWEIMFVIESNTVLQPVIKMRNYMILFIAIGSVAFSLYLWAIFRMNKITIGIISTKANIDSLTGLNNRNTYDEYCRSIKSTIGVTCIYIDANGLHEINNTQGHTAGDKMLKCIANALTIYFDKDNIYRIGGDEFVVMITNEDQWFAKKLIQAVATDIETEEYYISYGLSTGKPGLDIDDVIKNAEKKMYDMKDKYYATKNRKTRKEV